MHRPSLAPIAAVQGTFSELARVDDIAPVSAARCRRYSPENGVSKQGVVEGEALTDERRFRIEPFEC